MKFAVDRIEENIAVCQNLETKEMMEVTIDKLPKDIKDGTIIMFKDNEYKLDLTEEELRRKKIQERFNKLKSN